MAKHSHYCVKCDKDILCADTEEHGVFGCYTKGKKNKVEESYLRTCNDCLTLQQLKELIEVMDGLVELDRFLKENHWKRIAPSLSLWDRIVLFVAAYKPLSTLFA